MTPSRRESGRARRLSRVCTVLGVLAALAGSAPAAQAMGRAGDSVLTTDALTRLTTFWTAFAKEADSVRAMRFDTWHTPHSLLAVDTVYSGNKIDRTELMLDMTALAVTYPSVEADLKQAGLTGKRYHAIVATLLNACRTFNGGARGNPTTPTRVEAKNIAFLKAHQQEFDALIAAAHERVSEVPRLGFLAKAQIWGVNDCAHMAKALHQGASP